MGRVRQDGPMQERETPEAEPARQAEPTGPPPPLYGTRESAAGLPSSPVLGSPGGYGPPPAGPEGLARPGQRLLARLLDVAVVGFALVIVQIPMWLVIMQRDPRLRRVIQDYVQGPATEAQLLAVQQAMLPWVTLSGFVVLVIWFLYEVPSTARRGQTLGKAAVGITVASSRLTPRLGWRAAILRWLVLGLPSLFGIVGLMFQAVDSGWMLWDRNRRQTLHDKAAGTEVARVVRRPR
ncbi:MAG: hypothetical protein GEV10_18045 [Streptosporangiales bacterium]|nr:hypothetical protein [Streptosporangiales bacterium]